MKAITLSEAVTLIENCSAVIVDIDEADGLTYPNIADLTGDDDNEFLYVGWESGGDSYYVKCMEGNNRTVMVNDKNQLELIDHEGDPVKLTLLDVKKIS